MKRIVVIGGNAAGPAAAAKAKRIQPDAEVILLEKRGVISTGTCELPYLFSGEVSDPNHLVFFNDESFYHSKGVKVYTRHTADFIDTRNKKVIARSAETGKEVLFSFGSLVLATGSVAKSVPQLTPLPENAFTIKTVEDAQRFFQSGSPLRGKRVLVVGAGFAGVEMADALQVAGADVVLSDTSSEPLSRFDPDIRRLLVELLNQNNIRFLQIPRTADYLIKDNQFTGLKFNGQYHSFDLIFLSTGTEPSIQLAESSGLTITELNTVKVDNRLQTSQSGIFAAGDCIAVTDFVTNRPRFDFLATTAQKTGHIAGENAAGGRVVMQSQVRNVSLRVPGGFLLMTGLSLAEADQHKIPVVEVTATANSHVPVMPSSRVVFGKLILHKHSKQILGASFLGGSEISGYGDMISLMIRGRMPAAILEEVNYNYTPPLSPFIHILSVLGRKSKHL